MMPRRSLRFPNGIPRAAMSDNPPQADIDAVPVAHNGDLYDRIAAVLQRHRPMFNTFDGEPSDWCECGMPIDHVVDAVIEALNLRTDQVGTLTRYVTEWSAT